MRYFCELMFVCDRYADEAWQFLPDTSMAAPAGAGFPLDGFLLVVVLFITLVIDTTRKAA